MKSKNYSGCFGGLQALQGLLPKDYRIIVSTVEYNKLATRKLYYTCNHCFEEIEKDEIKVVDTLLRTIDSILLGKITRRIWECPKCIEENDLEDTEVSETTLQEPYFLKVIWKAPKIQIGLHGRTRFHIEMEVWVRTFLAELEAQMAQFRDDNWHKGDEELYNVDTDIDTEGESDD